MEERESCGPLGEVCGVIQRFVAQWVFWVLGVWDACPLAPESGVYGASNHWTMAGSEEAACDRGRPMVCEAAPREDHRAWGYCAVCEAACERPESEEAVDVALACDCGGSLRPVLAGWRCGDRAASVLACGECGSVTGAAGALDDVSKKSAAVHPDHRQTERRGAHELKEVPSGGREAEDVLRRVLRRSPGARGSWARLLARFVLDARADGALERMAIAMHERAEEISEAASVEQGMGAGHHCSHWDHTTPERREMTREVARAGLVAVVRAAELAESEARDGERSCPWCGHVSRYAVCERCGAELARHPANTTDPTALGRALAAGLVERRVRAWPDASETATASLVRTELEEVAGLVAGDPVAWEAAGERAPAGWSWVVPQTATVSASSAARGCGAESEREGLVCTEHGPAGLHGATLPGGLRVLWGDAPECRHPWKRTDRALEGDPVPEENLPPKRTAKLDADVERAGSNVVRFPEDVAMLGAVRRVARRAQERQATEDARCGARHVSGLVCDLEAEHVEHEATTAGPVVRLRVRWKHTRGALWAQDEHGGWRARLTSYNGWVDEAGADERPTLRLVVDNERRAEQRDAAQAEEGELIQPQMVCRAKHASGLRCHEPPHTTGMHVGAYGMGPLLMWAGDNDELRRKYDGRPIFWSPAALDQGRAPAGARLWAPGQFEQDKLGALCGAVHQESGITCEREPHEDRDHEALAENGWAFGWQGEDDSEQLVRTSEDGDESERARRDDVERASSGEPESAPSGEAAPRASIAELWAKVEAMAAREPQRPARQGGSLRRQAEAMVASLNEKERAVLAKRFGASGGHDQAGDREKGEPSGEGQRVCGARHASGLACVLAEHQEGDHRAYAGFAAVLWDVETGALFRSWADGARGPVWRVQANAVEGEQGTSGDGSQTWAPGMFGAVAVASSAQDGRSRAERGRCGARHASSLGYTCGEQAGHERVARPHAGDGVLGRLVWWRAEGALWREDDDLTAYLAEPNAPVPGRHGRWPQATEVRGGDDQAGNAGGVQPEANAENVASVKDDVTAWNVCPSCERLADLPDGEVFAGTYFDCIHCGEGLYAEVFGDDDWQLLRASEVEEGEKDKHGEPSVQGLAEHAPDVEPSRSCHYSGVTWVPTETGQETSAPERASRDPEQESSGTPVQRCGARHASGLVCDREAFINGRCDGEEPHGARRPDGVRVAWATTTGDTHAQGDYEWIVNPADRWDVDRPWTEWYPDQFAAQPTGAAPGADKPAADPRARGERETEGEQPSGSELTERFVLGTWVRIVRGQNAGAVGRVKWDTTYARPGEDLRLVAVVVKTERGPELLEMYPRNLTVERGERAAEGPHPGGLVFHEERPPVAICCGARHASGLVCDEWQHEDDADLHAAFVSEAGAMSAYAWDRADGPLYTEDGAFVRMVPPASAYSPKGCWSPDMFASAPDMFAIPTAHPSSGPAHTPAPDGRSVRSVLPPAGVGSEKVHPGGIQRDAPELPDEGEKEEETMSKHTPEEREIAARMVTPFVQATVDRINAAFDAAMESETPSNPLELAGAVGLEGVGRISPVRDDLKKCEEGDLNPHAG
ncbi:hypothetical protein [Polyangium fumosum]|uniref:Uncharacterized protein n=1 Tax=Polyangium fumosum TaxID=889272 RepID=A0A4U1J071_9BACT|nr:hypothetical protein [Polyangium fumosum]TKD00405.1 hypothetical protein E8A74_34490 [Polyangium fumosum]